jgi:ABC-type nickel/cobalt efflux system permease component RcnA
VALTDPQPMSDALQNQLADLGPDVVKLPPELEQQMRGVQGAILVKCPGGAAGTGEAPPAPATALDAADALAAASPAAQPLVVANDIPFGGPPPEPGLNLPRTGFFGWVAQVQKDFYIALTGALGRLKSDWTAFWVLGTLSFLYGIFHAAGPGHGKVVISSYVLANEQQVRRGIWLSFLSAMMQSAVAVAFVLILALALGLTSMALSDAANSIGIVSYAMVALLGLWLIVRHVMGWGHQHSHSHESAPLDDRRLLARQHLGAPAHALAVGGPPLTSFQRRGLDEYGRMPGHEHYGHSHGDEDGHDHAHVVMPNQTGGGWREQLGVVLAVGLRPCSGALVVLVFALSQGVLAAGIAAVFLMGLGTAITTGTLAALAVGAKGLARALAGADNPLTATLVWWAELLGAVAVLAFGIVLLIASF